MALISVREKNTIMMLVRQVLYTTFLVLAIFVLWKFAKQYRHIMFEENGPIENIQCIVLVMAIFCFGLCAILNKAWTPLLIGFMSMCFLALCREQDAFWENHLPVVSWKFGFLFPLVAAGYVGSHFRKLKGYLFSFFEMPAFHLMITAMVVIIPISECIGHRPFVTAIIGSDEYGRPIRRLIEESGELLGYLLILFAAIELIFNIKSRQKLHK